jgi:hypothetical protein
MRTLDFSSTLVAGIIGGVLLWILVLAFGKFLQMADPETGTNVPSWGVLFAAGFVIGAGVQTGVRLTGVS